jgi:alpha-galactosidase
VIDMSFDSISEFRVADLTFSYLRDTASGLVGLECFPTSLRGQLSTRRTGLAGLFYIDAMPDAGNPPAFAVDPLVHVKISGDPYTAGFAQGHTMRNAPSIDRFRYNDQRVEATEDETTVITNSTSPDGFRLEHRLSWHQDDSAVKIGSAFYNESDQPVTLEMLSSFSLGGITPFDSADAPGRLRVHRFRSVWSAEGRHETQSIEELHLERSWSGAGAFSERFGQIGSMPVRKWFPFVAIEDIEANVLWGAQLAWAGSWQMEVFRQHDSVCLSGGLADREFGHWQIKLSPGESLVAPSAFISCASGTLDDLCDRLTALQARAADTHPQIEQDLPIIFNEWCTTWGNPQHDKVVAIAKRLRESEVKYLVIDAGWYKSDGGNWGDSHGDWSPNAELFPHGLEAMAAAIRSEGLVPGLWFEMETCGSSSAAFRNVDHLLKRDGVPLTVRDRRFWDLNDDDSVEFLTDRVINLLERCQFDYLKVDYNETIGLGCDHPDSLGEGLRQQTYGSYRFFNHIRERLPNLVIENCSSGGHRLEPSMLALSAMSSFSDAHELVEIPIIAANLHRLILPRQSQIWAVLHRSDSHERLAYSLAATFLGRMCLSGEIDSLNDAQWELVLHAQRFYRRIAPIIKSGKSRRYGEMGESWRHPTGWQAVVRTSFQQKEALVVMHCFADSPSRVEVPLPAGRWDILEDFSAGGTNAAVNNGKLDCEVRGAFTAQAVHLTNATT